MNNKNNIDKLFREKLQEFEATPNASVWDSISTQLSQDVQPRKAIPMWWKIAGIAAGILILVSIGNLIINPDSDNQPAQEVVDQDSDTDTPVINNSGENKEPNSIQNQSVTPVETENLNRQDTEVVQDNSSVEDSRSAVQNAIADTNIESKGNRLNQEVTDPNLSGQKSNPTPKDDLPLIDEPKKVEDAIADDSDKGNKNLKSQESKQEKTKAGELINKREQTDDSRLAENKNNSKDTKAIESVENSEAVEDAKSDIEEAIAAQSEEEEMVDDEEMEEIKKKRWGVAPNIAPVYFNSLGNGSAIDKQFANNSRSGEINMNYGISATYDLNDKFTLRAGINQMKFGYSTNDVIVYNNIQPSTEDKPLRNVNLNAESMDLSFLSVTGLNVAQVPGVVAANIESSIDQELGFIEIPLEMEYKISDNKLGLSLIGGMSTLILNENKVYSSLQGVRNELGEASNINSTSFSANLGVGMKYKVSESINLNLEPVFKYQLNTFKDTSGNFKPYVIGVYTGFSFKF